MSLDLSEIACNIEAREDGLWTSRTHSKVSYPDEGNDACFAVEDASFWFRHRNNCILQAMTAYPPSGTLFDIGGGNGYVARAVQDAGTDVVLVEPGAAGAQNARVRGVRHVVHSTLENAGFQGKTLPAVGLFDVLEHIQDDQAFLENLNRLMWPDGRVYVTVPAYPALWSREDDVAGHWRRYTLGSLSRVLNRSGFAVEFATHFFAFLPVPILLMRVLPYRLRRQSSQNDNGRMKAEHQPGTLAAGVLRMLTRRELSRVAAGRRSAFGASCLAVARKS
ncbi:MAG TPA: class I SAM-dependent methyltransferase [Bryobacteraceae bacterium]|jgi:SAM-dependent methyltransferase